MGAFWWGGETHSGSELGLEKQIRGSRAYISRTGVITRPYSICRQGVTPKIIPKMASQMRVCWPGTSGSCTFLSVLRDRENKRYSKRAANVRGQAERIRACKIFRALSLSCGLKDKCNGHPEPKPVIFTVVFFRFWLIKPKWIAINSHHFTLQRLQMITVPRL